MPVPWGLVVVKSSKTFAPAGIPDPVSPTSKTTFSPLLYVLRVSVPTSGIDSTAFLEEV
jgi:hypothetical protein